MRSFAFNDVAAVSGLGREWVDDLVAEPGFPLYGAGRRQGEPGTGGAFLAPDLFNLSLAGALHRLGLGRSTIGEIVAGLGRCACDPRTGLPVEMFPGQRRAQFGPRLLLVRKTGDGFAVTLVAPSELWAGVAAYEGAHLVIDVTALAERIAARVP